MGVLTSTSTRSFWKRFYGFLGYQVTRGKLAVAGKLVIDTNKSVILCALLRENQRGDLLFDFFIFFKFQSKVLTKNYNIHTFCEL